MRRRSKKSRSKSARKRGHRVGLSAREEDQLKCKLRLTTPSEPWVEAQFSTNYDRDASGNPVAYRYRDPHVFPPGGPNTLMVRCSECGIFNPPNAMEHGKCLDHAKHQGYGPSPSALAIEGMRRLNVRIEEEPLPPEDAKSLQREIEKYHNSGVISAHELQKFISRPHKE
jgi:hypothetical protein